MQKQEQQMKLSLQQLQLVKLLELSIGDYEESVKKEMVENPALEEGAYDDDIDMDSKSADSSDEMEENDTGEDPYSDSDYQELASGFDDGDLPVYKVNNGVDERNDLPLGDSGSFIEYLESQIVNYDLDEVQQQVLRYLIGLLDNRGFIDLPISTIVDELSFKEYIDVDEQYVEDLLKVLQSFDPPGIGARNVQECLLLQIDRQLDEDIPVSEMQERFLLLQRSIVSDYFNLFLNKNKEKLKSELKLNEVAVNAVFDALKKLNVNPGLALAESESSRVETQIPDFIVETDPEGGIELRLNSGDVPRLHVRRDYVEQMKMLQANTRKLSRSEKEGLQYTKEKVEAAQMFIESVKQRRRTLYETMKAIIHLQRPFILSKDENDKKRMVLKDVAELSGYDISTVSRVCKSKCALLDGRIYKLEEFFKLTRKNAQGKEVDKQQVTQLLSEIIEHEDKSYPYTDDQLAELMKAKGIALARRTVAKYRNELGIPPVADRQA
ncbi:MAG: RNA polymerase factor sigma-54 [Prevotellaceae bacterium]|nr:RNA polymerase factor sigma-54 [Candidatus Minthosoma caballi]